MYLTLLCHLRGAFKDKCECLSSSSIEGPTEAQEGSFERPESNKQDEIVKPPEVHLWRPYRRL